MDKFTTCMSFISLWEWGNRVDGGYTNDPTDPGGETKYGMSKRAHPNVDIKNLKKADALDMYKRDYWDRCGCDNLDYPLCLAVMDAAVNVGTGRALGWLKTTADFKTLIELRTQFYLELVEKKPALKKYIKGWLNRLNDLKKYADIVKPE